MPINHKLNIFNVNKKGDFFVVIGLFKYRNHVSLKLFQKYNSGQYKCISSKSLFRDDYYVMYKDQ